LKVDKTISFSAQYLNAIYHTSNNNTVLFTKKEKHERFNNNSTYNIKWL